MEVRYDVVGVVDGEVDRWRGEEHPGDPADGEHQQERQRVQHRGGELQRPAPQRRQPVEDLHSGRHRDQKRHQREVGQVHQPGGEHVVRPHPEGIGGDPEEGEHQRPVAEDRLAGEHRDHL